jgi:hypothetical protein
LETSRSYTTLFISFLVQKAYIQDTLHYFQDRFFRFRFRFRFLGSLVAPFSFDPKC